MGFNWAVGRLADSFDHFGFDAFGSDKGSRASTCKSTHPDQSDVREADEARISTLLMKRITHQRHGLLTELKNGQHRTKTVIVTGGSQGIGSGIVRAFLDRDYNVVATSRSITKSRDLPSTPRLALVDGDIGEASTAARVAETNLSAFSSIDGLVNNAGIFLIKRFTDYTAEDFKQLFSTNLEGFIYLTQLAINQMLTQKSGGSIVSITASLADSPIAGLTASVPMNTRGGMNAVAPGMVDTPLQRNSPKDFLKGLSPMGIILDVQELVDAVIYLAEAPHVTGEILHVDGGQAAGHHAI
jgi:NAD(P)-dependent dehydrogenase (short-subunit alcohol dehydrogenase family)